VAQPNNVREIPLPEHGLAYTIPADAVFEGSGWTGLRLTTIALTRALQQFVQDDVIAWLCPLAGMGDDGKVAHLVGLIFTFAKAHVPAQAAGIVEQHKGSLALRPAGEQAPPDMAFPAFLAESSTLYRAWLNDPEHRVCLYLSRDPGDDEIHNVGVESLDELSEVEPTDLPSVFIDFEVSDDPFVPAISQLGPDALSAEAMDLERLKVAFSWQFVYMVMNADGHVDEKEKAFMARLFPTSLLASVNLVDHRGEFREPAFTLARTEALRVLPEALPMDERVALLRTLKQAAWADGVLVPEEADVYEAAAEMLGVPLATATKL
jgi:uncharacterized tellurite resistance protein B-like protein